MNGLVLMSKEQTMSSLEISELVESRHDDVKRSIQRLSERGAIELPPMAEIKTATKPIRVYQISKRDSYVIVAQLSPEFTARLVDRWQELEKQVSDKQFAIPQTLSEALMLAGKLAAENEAQAAKIEADKPKVEFAMAVRRMDGACSVGDFAKVIGYGRNRFFEMLRNDGYLMPNNRPYQRYIEQELLVLVEQTPYTDRDGVAHPSFTTFITGKGQVFFEKKYRKAA